MERKATQKTLNKIACTCGEDKWLHPEQRTISFVDRASENYILWTCFNCGRIWKGVMIAKSV